LMPNRRKVLRALVADGNILLGVSNQAFVSRGKLTADEARACFDRTNELLGVVIDYEFCPHSVPPTCYCRKPQSGLGVLLVERYELHPPSCVFVGDQTTDKTFAKRMGFQYYDQKDFF